LPWQAGTVKDAAACRRGHTWTGMDLAGTGKSPNQLSTQWLASSLQRHMTRIQIEISLFGIYQGLLKFFKKSTL